MGPRKRFLPGTRGHGGENVAGSAVSGAGQNGRLRGGAQKVLLVDAWREDVAPKNSKKGFTDLGAIGMKRPPVPKGVIALFSCSPTEASHEFDELEHGVFTKFVLDYLGGKKSGARYSKDEFRIT